MSNQAHIDQIHDIIKDIKYAMFTTTTSEGHLHSWPMTTTETCLTDEEIWFIGDKDSDIVKNVKNSNQVNLSYSSPDEKNYVSINGKAELVENQEKLDEMWSPIYNAYFEHGKEDDSVQLIKVVPHGAQYWMSGNSVVNMFKMAAAALQDGKTAEDVGECHTVTF